MKRVAGRVAPALLAIVASGSLTACGSSSDEPSSTPTVRDATTQEINQYADSTVDDVQKLATKVAAAHKKDGSFPTSAKGLITLAHGNEIAVYTVKPIPAADGLKVAHLCVQHLEKQRNPNNTKEVVDTPLAAADTNVFETEDGGLSYGGDPGVSKRAGCTQA